MISFALYIENDSSQIKLNGWFICTYSARLHGTNQYREVYDEQDIQPNFGKEDNSLIMQITRNIHYFINVVNLLVTASPRYRKFLIIFL